MDIVIIADYKQQVFNTRVWHDFSSKSKLSFQFNYTNSPYALMLGELIYKV